MNSAGWIGGRTWDLAFFFGSSALALVIGVVLLAVPAWVVPAWWLWLLLADGPHLLATWLRVYADSDERAARGTLIFSSLLFFVPGFVAFAISKATGSKDAIDLFLLVATIWAFHHAVRQNYGILSIYQRTSGASARLRWLDKWFLHLALWAMYVLFVVGNRVARVSMRLPESLPRAPIVAFAALIALATVAYAGTIVWRASRGIGIRAPLFVLVPVIALEAFALFVVGAFEPLVPHPMNPEQAFLAAGLVGGLPHGLQYLGIIFAVNKKRYASAGSGWVARLGRAPLAAYGVLVAASLAYIAVNVLRGGTPDLAPFGVDSDTAVLALAFYWGAFFHHYWIDQKIWQVQKDARLRVELGLA